MDKKVKNTMDMQPRAALNEPLKLFQFNAVCINNETGIDGVTLPWEQNRIYGGHFSVYDNFVIDSGDGLLVSIALDEFKRHFRICELSPQLVELFSDDFFESIYQQGLQKKTADENE